MTTTTNQDQKASGLSNEPVTVGGAVIVFGNAVLGALPLFGVDLSAEQVGAANLVLAALVALIAVLIRHFTVSKARVDKEFTHNDDVVEKIEDHQVVAGEGSELPTGTHVREAGDLAYNPEDGSYGSTDAEA